eukprot:gene25164-10795_t
MLESIAAHTVDDQGRRAFVTDNVLQCLRKVGAKSKGGGPGQARGDRPGIRGLYVGFMFSEIGAHTVDDKGRRAFVTDNVLQCLRKVGAKSKGGGPGQARGDRPGIRGLYVGFMFSEIGAHTVDDKGRRAFVTDNVLQCLRKAVSLAKISIYFDVDRPFLKPPDNRTWKQLTRAEWDRLFVPERHYEDGAYDNDVYPHDYLVCPVSGNMKYTR